MSRKTRKLIWSAPLVAVFAIVGALAAIGALGIGGVFAHDAPGAPQNLTVKPASGPDGRTTLVLDWDAPATGMVESYRVDMSSDGGKWKYHTSVTDTTYSHGMLDPDTRMYYRVFAVNSAGTGPVSRDVSASTNDVSVPGKVNLKSAMSASGVDGPTQINLAWDMPDDGGASISKYCIAVLHSNRTGVTATDIADTNCNEADPTNAAGLTAIRETNGTGIIVISAKDSNGDPVTGYQYKSLRAGQMWDFMVYAVNSEGRSRLPSDERGATTADALRPAKPTNLTVFQVTDANTVRLYWNGPTTDGGQDIVGYRVDVSDTAGHWPTPPAAPAANADFSGVASTDPLAEQPADSGRMVLSILVAESSATESYQLQHSDSTGTLAGETLYYRVRTETGDPDDRQVSLWSETKSVTTVAATALDQVFRPTVTPTVEADNKTGEIKLTFTGSQRQRAGESSPSDFEPTGYRVDVSTDTGVTWQTENNYTRRIDGNEFEYRGVKAGTTRHFRVFAWDGSDLGIASAVVAGTAGPVRIPGRVGSFDVSAPALPAGAGQIDLSWSTPTNNGGGAITRYCISALRITSAGAAVSTASPLPSVIDADGTDPDNCGASMSPTNAAGLKAIRDANAGVIVINAEDAAGNPVTSYEHKGLLTGQRWRYQVFAVNSAGPATSGDTSDDATGKAAPPAAPQHFTAESAHDSNTQPPGTRGIVLLWTLPPNPPGAPVTGFRIQRKVDDGEFETVQTTSNTHWVDKSQPADGQARSYRVVAINSAGHDEANYAESMFIIMGTGDDQMLMFLPEHSHPPVSTMLTAASNVLANGTTTAGEIEVEWTAGANAVGHVIVVLDNGDNFAVETVAVPTADGEHTITGLSAGTYTVVVVSFTSATEYEYDTSGGATDSVDTAVVN